MIQTKGNSQPPHSRPQDRPLFHIHIPKTAGLTLHVIFMEIFGVEQVFKLGAAGPHLFNKIEGFVAGNCPGLDENHPPSVYIGHFPFGAQARISPSPFISVCLRHPVERVLSLYGYACRWHRQIFDIDHFLETTPESSNGMVRRLCGYAELDGVYYDFVNQRPLGRDQYDLDERDLENARSNLENSVDYLLIQERMVESLVGFRHALNTPPLFSMDSHFLNHSPKPTTREDYAPAIIEKIVQLNQLDIQLYERGLELFNLQIESQKLPAWELDATRQINDFLSIRDQNQRSGERFVLNRLKDSLFSLLEQGNLELAIDIVKLFRERLPNNPSISEAYLKLTKAGFV